MIAQQILDQDGDEMVVTCDGELVTVEIGREIRQFRLADWELVLAAMARVTDTRGEWSAA
jgi:hypothetical protein